MVSLFLLRRLPPWPLSLHVSHVGGGYPAFNFTSPRPEARITLPVVHRLVYVQFIRAAIDLPVSTRRIRWRSNRQIAGAKGAPVGSHGQNGSE